MQVRLGGEDAVESIPSWWWARREGGAIISRNLTYVRLRTNSVVIKVRERVQMHAYSLGGQTDARHSICVRCKC